MVTPASDHGKPTMTAMSEAGSGSVTSANQRRQAADKAWTIVGPLTTTFSPPQDCSQLKGVRYSSTSLDLFWGGNCSTRGGIITDIFGPETDSPGPALFTPALSCYPSGYTFEKAWFGGGGYITAHYATTFYSPGLTCPTGWEVVAIASDGERLNLDGALGDLLKPGEKMVGCCPKYDFTVCRSSLPPTDAVAVSTFDSSCAAKMATVQLRDTAATTATTGITILPTATAGVLHLILPAGATFQPPLPASPGETSLALSHTAKIAVGIAVPLGVILLALLILMWRKLHRQRTAKMLEQRRQQGQGQGPPGDQPIAQTDEAYAKAELEADHGTAEAASRGVAFEKPELHHEGAVVRQELSALRDPLEMDATNRKLPPELEATNTTKGTGSTSSAAAPAATVNATADGYGEPWRWSEPLFAPDRR